MPILRHLHLPNLTSYAHASHLQEILVSRLLRHKASLSKASPQTLLPPPPPPTILTFTPHPIYTTGRRDTTPPSPSQLALLHQPLDTADGPQVADFERALRGGQITFHGPGQLVIYPVFSLAHPYSFAPGPAGPAPGCAVDAAPPDAKPSLSPRCYVHRLEAATMAALARHGIAAVRTADPGVWVDGDTKIAAVGVHLRRNVTSHGVGLNVHTDLRWFGRIVACGLEGKGVTSIREQVLKRKKEVQGVDGVDGVMSVEEVADMWVGAFARECGLREADVVRVTAEEILAEGDGEEG